MFSGKFVVVVSLFDGSYNFLSQPGKISSGNSALGMHSSMIDINAFFQFSQLASAEVGSRMSSKSSESSISFVLSKSAYAYLQTTHFLV